MKVRLVTIIVSIFSWMSCGAVTVFPLKPHSITVDYGIGRMAKFTYETEWDRILREHRRTAANRRRAAFSFDPATFSPEPPLAFDHAWPARPQGTPARLVKIEFEFENGRIADVAAADLEGIEIGNLTGSEIESLVEPGSWVLSVEIRNAQQRVDRVANDRAVFTFRSYEYVGRHLEINSRRNARK